MNKKKFLELIRKPETIEAKDREELQSLAADHPYSQIILALIAKGSKNLGLDDLSDDLNTAAVSTSYRPVLKAFIEGEVIEEEPEVPVEQEKPVPAPEPEPEPEAEPEPEPSPEPQPEEPEEETPANKGKTITFELKEDMEKPEDYELKDLLKTLRKNREAYDDPEEEQQDLQDTATQQEETVQVEPPQEQEDEDSDEARARSLIDELRQSSEKNDLDDKVREQQEIIDRFIESEPDLTQHKDVEQADSEIDPVDLAEMSTAQSDQLISENLANIYLKQGKVDKAIDIYKKLIWKFPQKKTYFADRIRELTQQ